MTIVKMGGMELLSITDVAKELNLSQNRVRTFCQDGRLGRKVGHQWIITRDELEAFKKLPRKRGIRINRHSAE